MSLTLEEISDRIELQDLCYRYAQLIDERDFGQLESVFTADAHIDYSAMGGSVGNLPDTIEFLTDAMTIFSNFQHLNSNLQFTVQGDTATGRVMCFNPMELETEDGSVHSFMLGLWYNDEYIRTAQGWRIVKRTEEKSWMLNEPEFMKPLRSL
jgi:hypothetical protein